MSIWQKAYETYQNHEHLAGLELEGKQPLTPVGHIVQKAQIEITVSADGKFISAEEVPKNDCKTVIPATEASANKVGDSPCPHPLSDQLRYLSASGGKRHELYLNQLHDWEQSEYAVPKLHAIARYIEGGSILKDLQTAGMLGSDEAPLSGKAKIAGTEPEKCLVRWRVTGAGAQPECWRDTELFRSYQEYQRSLPGEKEEAFCMISGQPAIPARLHPKGVVAAAYSAKLISANDSLGFTYRGRFTEAAQAATIGFDASQKAHSALQWVAANEGVVYGGRTFICWNPKGKPVFRIFDPFETDAVSPTTDPSSYRRALRLTMDGYRNELPDDEDVVIAAFDAATTGRLSVTYYSEQKALDFHRRIENWYATCCMPNGKFGIQSPPLNKIVRCAFGTERSKRIELDDRVLREQSQRLLYCVTEFAAIPPDIVRALRNRASRPQNYKESNNRQELLHTACAVIRKYLNDKANKEEWTMVLDTNNQDRSYLFGRMLAVMEYAERSTYKDGEDREPNAVRMQSVFSQRPMYAANILENKLKPYIQRLSPGKKILCSNLMGEIYSLFRPEDADKLNRPLEDTYLLGYYLQRNELYSKKNKDTEE